MLRGGFAAMAAITGALALAAPAAAQESPLATCFWEGPISTERPSARGFDGRNFNFPEESATYWLARFRLPAGARLVLRGRYAHARYESLNAYSDGAPTDSLADVEIAPDAGSVNPFRAGARRDAAARSFQVKVIDASPPTAPADRAENTLYARAGAGAPIEIVHRVYEPDRGRDLTGGVGLPEPELVLPDGRVVRGDALCAQVNDADRNITVQTTPAPVWQAATRAPGCDPATSPAYRPVRWERFFNLDYASLAVVSDCTEAGRRARLARGAEVEGGFYSNRDNAYIYAHLSRRFGPLLVVRMTAPTYPATREGQRVMGRGQLRFWSLCTGESRVTTRTPDCLADRQVPTGTRTRETLVVVSRREDRPANATGRCGVAWLDWGERGDAAGRPDYGLLILRHMLPAPDFAAAIQNVRQPGTEAQVMGDHFPRSDYTTKAGFERQGCDPMRLELPARRLRAGRDGRARVPVRCAPARDACTGRLRLTGAPGTSLAGRRLGGTRFTAIPGGSTRTIPVHLTRATRAALAEGTLSVRIFTRGATPHASPLVARRTATLHGP